MGKTNITNKIRRNRIWKKSGGVCAHCGKYISERKQTVDHFIPKFYGGTNDQRNLMPLCLNCNRTRQHELVEPGEYYPYANAYAIDMCLEYRSEQRELRLSASGCLY